jgi:hypothetical protein
MKLSTFIKKYGITLWISEVDKDPKAWKESDRFATFFHWRLQKDGKYVQGVYPEDAEYIEPADPPTIADVLFIIAETSHAGSLSFVQWDQTCGTSTWQDTSKEEWQTYRRRSKRYRKFLGEEAFATLSKMVWE